MEAESRAGDITSSFKPLDPIMPEGSDFSL